MKILAIEQELPDVKADEFRIHARDEAALLWELYQAGVLREFYFRADKTEAVLMLECDTINEARGILNTLPMVKNKLIDFNIIPLAPYPGFARLFGG